MYNQDLDSTNLYNPNDILPSTLYYMDSNGNYIEEHYDDFFQTNAIKINEGDTISIYGVTKNTGTYFISFFKNSDITVFSDLYYMEQITPTDSVDSKSYTIYKIPKGKGDCYISIAGVTAYINSVVITRNLLRSELCHTGFCYGSNDNGVTVAKWTGASLYQSNPISVSSGDKVLIYGTTPNAGIYYVSFLNSSNIDDINSVAKVLKAEPVEQNGYSYFEFTVPDNVSLISVGGMASSIEHAVINKYSQPYQEGQYVSYVVENDTIYHIFDEDAHNKINQINDAVGIYDFHDKIVNCLGDSITAGVGANTTWVKGVSDNLGCIANNYGVSATAICDHPNEEFVTRLNRMTETTVDLLLIFGGTNDYGDDRIVTLGNINDEPVQGNNFYASFKYLIESAINKYSSAIIGIIIPLRRYSHSANAHNITMEDVVTAELEIAELYALPVLDMYHHGMINPEIEIHKNNYMPDGLHPNQAGLDKFITPRITNFVRKLLAYT